MTEQDLFIDKLKLTAAMQEKEGQLVGSFASLIRKIQSKLITVDEAYTSGDYENTWRLCLELYLFMRYNKLAELEKDNKERMEQLDFIMGKYQNITELGIFTITDLGIAVDLITFFMSKAGYHSDKAMYSSGSFDDE